MDHNSIQSDFIFACNYYKINKYKQRSLTDQKFNNFNKVSMSSPSRIKSKTNVPISPLSAYFLSPFLPSPPQKQSLHLSKSSIQLHKHHPSPKHNTNNKTDDKSTTDLINKLKTHREKLLSNLHNQTLLYNLQPIPKCRKHQLKISGYNKNTNQLQCAGCYKKMSSPSPHNIILLQKAKSYIQSDTIQMKQSIEKEINVIRNIQEILYEGFQKEKSEMEKFFVFVDQYIDDVVLCFGRLRKNIREVVLGRYDMERKKHEMVITQLGMLRTLVSDYLKSTTHIPINHPQSPTPTNTPYLQPNPYTIPTQPQSNNQSHKQLAFIHNIYNEISNSIKFNKQGFNWSQQKHKNKIKQTTDTIIKDIQKIQKFVYNLLENVGKYGDRR